MATYLHRTTFKLYLSVSTNPITYPTIDYVKSPDLSPVSGEPAKYWILTGDILSVMSQAQKDAVDAQEAADLVSANRVDIVSAVDSGEAIGVENRALLHSSNKRDNYIINRLAEVQQTQDEIANAITGSSGGADNLRTAVAAVSLAKSATNTRSLAETTEDFKDDVNSGLAD